MYTQYLEQLKAKGKSQNTINKYEVVLKALNDFKPIEDVTKQDIVLFFERLRCTDETRRTYQSKIKKFYTDIGKREMVSWIKLVKPKERLKAGINKPVNPNAFRNAQATMLVQQGVLGLTPTSSMMSIYQHLDYSEAGQVPLRNYDKTLQKLVINEIKQPYNMSLVAAAIQFSKIVEENKELKERVACLEKGANLLDAGFQSIKKRIEEIRAEYLKPKEEPKLSMLERLL